MTWDEIRLLRGSLEKLATRPLVHLSCVLPVRVWLRRWDPVSQSWKTTGKKRALDMSKGYPDGLGESVVALHCGVCFVCAAVC